MEPSLNQLTNDELKVLLKEERQKIIPTVLVHGGAGDVADDQIVVKNYGIKMAARTGYEKLMSTGKVVDAVQHAVQYLESDPNFNAGKGATLTWDGDVSMDAGIMNGSDLNAGCVAVAKDILHPIALARTIMDKARHTFYVGDGAMVYAKEANIDILPKGALITERNKKDLEAYKICFAQGPDALKGKIFGSPGTVGAVAIDAEGNVAAATSTGGYTGKMTGRVGDSPLLGAGTYADNASGCVSCTGNGDYIMRFNVASKILTLTQHFGLTAQEATTKIVDEMAQLFNTNAGVICIDSKGNLAVHYTSKRMPWAYQRGEELHYGIEKGEHNVDII